MEKQQIPILSSSFNWPGLEPKIYRTPGKHANYDTTVAVAMLGYKWLKILDIYCSYVGFQVIEDIRHLL